ncbi:Multidrug efflux pump subunit AcrA (membrane-fusion protein) [Muriicola jejuensis]|uniref:HlyD family efflux transporter periplasmic adaptor subunit n=1 Tax=Muriicola jejuensis TaxID=504488 RepID=A0A6P0UGU1_9FLAO|nr:HlyD family efflux transporter periplasmic adaptor subunit [Muriicola jejuensis]NER11680.1 HlyD family efflux transporter periplasmic adaptor subunit [Muriicola jejuensis]SMP25468.1 Multidrug efflux pump subunit AcrA (membrane-fusion protein) [Muriicola jejuensis]
MRKIILYSLGVIILVLAVFVAYLLVTAEEEKRPVARREVKTVFVDTVVNRTIPIVIPANGNLAAKERVEIYSEVQGIFRSSSHPFKPGQAFRKGEVLLRIDADEYAASVQSAKSNLYNLITAAMPDLRLDYPEDYPKWQAYLSAFDMEKSTPDLPEITSEKERYFISGRNILTTYYNVKNLERRLSKYILRAPFNGVLTEALVTEGSLIRPGQKLGAFINPEVYELQVAVNKSYSDFLKVGEEVALENLEGTQQFRGKVARINAAVNQESQTVSVFIDVKDERVKEGMYLEAQIEGRSEENAFEISRKLLNDQKELFVVKDSILDVLEVTPVYFSDKTAILKGVEEGTVILSRPVPGAYAGMVVRAYRDTTNLASAQEINPIQ